MDSCNLRFSPNPFLVVFLAGALVLAGCASEAPTPATTTASATPTAAPDTAVPAPSEATETADLTDPVLAETPPTEPTDPPEAVTQLGGTEFVFVDVAEAVVPIGMVAYPDGESFLVASKFGEVFRYFVAEDGQLHSDTTPLIDLSEQVALGGEQGLLGIAVNPAGTHIYLVHSRLDGANRLVEYGIDGADEREVLIVEQPYANHNGGHITFGPDGYLYYGLGDGGSDGDPNGTGQDPTDLLASILRIDPAKSGADAYTIPADNPFESSGGATEVWLYGARNPWRFSFDRTTGDLWIGDVGETAREEIDWLPAADGAGAGSGVNLGWPLLEGNAPFRGGNPDDYVAPVLDYDRDAGQSIIGGYISRGGPAEVEGVYIYGDWGTGTIWGLILNDDGQIVTNDELGTVPDFQLLSFSQGPSGRLFVLLADGAIQRLDVAE